MQATRAAPPRGERRRSRRIFRVDRVDGAAREMSEEDPSGFAAEGLLEGLEGDARSARERLLQELLDDGVPLEELREACAEDRLALLPVDRVLATETPYTARDLAEKAGVSLDDLRAARAAFGLPIADDDARFYGESDLRMAENLRAVLDTGVPIEKATEFNRVVGRAMMQVAAASRGLVGEAMLRPGMSEYDLAEIAAATTRELAPRMETTLGYVYARQLRSLLRSDVVSAADLAAGRPAGAREMTVAFADLVGFTRLGEEVDAEELGTVAQKLEQMAAERVEKPVTLVKTVGDAVMLVSPDPDAMLDNVLDLVTATRNLGEGFPELRIGVSCGPTLERAGDWYGSPVNQASRITGVARPSSVLVAEAVKERADGWDWSFAGERKLKGVGAMKLYRARRPEPSEPD
jgi:adenylate cyclase